MTTKRDDALSDFARQLLAAEREQVEPESLKARALARAQGAVLAEREAALGLSSSARWRALRKVVSLPRVLVPAAALALAGLAAAAAGILAEPPGPPSPRPIVEARPQAEVKPRSVEKPESALVSPPEVRSSPEPSSTPPSSSVAATARAKAPPKRVEPTSARPAAVRQYALELELLEPARQAIARGSYGAALEAVNRHEQAFPNGQLAEERSALRVRALWSSGRREEARRAAAAFARRYPRSGLLSWMPAANASQP